MEISKSPGPDSLYPIVLYELREELAVPLTYLFNASLESGELPDDWKLGEVKALFKKGCKFDPENYRPILGMATENKLICPQAK